MDNACHGQAEPTPRPVDKMQPGLGIPSEHQSSRGNTKTVCNNVNYSWQSYYRPYPCSIVQFWCPCWSWPPSLTASCMSSSQRHEQLSPPLKLTAWHCDIGQGSRKLGRASMLKRGAPGPTYGLAQCGMYIVL